MTPTGASVCRIAGVLTDRSGRRDVAYAPPAYAEGRPFGYPPVGTIEQECVPQDVALSDTLTVCGDRDDRGPPVEPVPEKTLLGRDATRGELSDDRCTIVEDEQDPPWVCPRGDVVHEPLQVTPRARHEQSQRGKLAGGNIEGPPFPAPSSVGKASPRDRAPSFPEAR